MANYKLHWYIISTIKETSVTAKLSGLQSAKLFILTLRTIICLGETLFDFSIKR